jgi:hypothetical protein
MDSPVPIPLSFSFELAGSLIDHRLDCLAAPPQNGISTPAPPVVIRPPIKPETAFLTIPCF